MSAPPPGTPGIAVELDLYSGRPNPRFTLAPDAAAELGRRVAALQEIGPRAEVGEPPLGYRGVLVCLADGGTLTISAGAVRARGPGGATRWLADGDRRLEAWLLERAAAALPGAMPPPAELMRPPGSPPP